MFKRARTSFASALVLVSLTSVLTASLWGQSTQGGVRGTVNDPSGAPIANVKVTLTNEGTGEPRTTLTNGSGSYDFESVVPATYTVSAESASFKKYERKNIVLGTQEFLTVDVPLEVGAVSESVTVTEAVPLVEASNASQGQVLDNQKLVDLPNLGRNPFMMSRLSANVIQVGPPAYNRMEDQSGSSEISIAGGPIRGNNYLLDGIPITDANNRAIIIPSLEAVQEVKIQANTYDAEMARTGGGMFNTLMKSGANEYHGSAYGHLRRTDWDANNFFNNAAGIPISPQPNSTWGASFGGKIWIPKVYNGKNKTFFWIAVEHYDDEQSDSSGFAFPTALERVGDFSQSNLAAAKLTLLDPTTGLPIPGNKIPTSELNPVGLNMASLYPLPTSTPAHYGLNDTTLASGIKARAVQYTGKLDEDFTSWWRSSLSYLRYYSLEPGDTWWNSPATQSGWRLARRVDTTQLNNIFTLNPTTILTVRYGFNRFPNFDYTNGQGFNLGSLGFASNFVNSVSPSISQFPTVNMSTISGLGDTGDNSYYDEYSHNFSFAVDKYIGKHNLKAGFDYRKLGTAGISINNSTGAFGFNSTTNTYTGVDLGDLLTGYPYSRQADTASHFNDTINYYGAFAQDDYRVNSKLTINMGLRWERELGVQEAHNELVTGFNTTVANVLASKVSGISPVGAVEYAGLGGNPTHVGNYSANKFSPRIGVAYQLNAKTILRGGYGIFYAPQIAIGSPISTLGYSATTSYNGSVNASGQAVPTLTNPFPTGLIQPSGNSLGTAAGLGQTFSLVDPNAKSTRVQQYSFDIQRELPMGIALEVGYVGSHTTDLTLGSGAIDINALNPSYFSMGKTALNTAVTNPYFGLVSSGTLGSATVPQYQLLRPFSAYQNINLIYNSKDHASYNSAIIKAQKRFSKGLTFLSSLTWSRNMDETDNPAGNSLNGGAQGAPQNPYNIAAEYSLSNFDTPLRWTSSVSYELPFGKGKPYANHSTALDLLVGGWSLNSVIVYQTGFPLQVYQSNNNSAYGYGAQRPNATGVAPGTSGSVEARLGEYINPAAFSLAPAATFGNISRTLTLLGPGQKNWDMSLFKTYTVKERFKAQFRFEALNAFNSPLFSAPNTNFSSGSFGTISSTQNFARQLELALRFSF
jgi:hypothetical protein